ncbi:MAG: hypothetical protein J6Z46_05220 [Lachnospiraceae bacterium]|nr:hypothetical protein [Lachnospiraceae bacterium]
MLIRGRVSSDDRGTKIIASDIKRLDDFPGKLWIRFKNRAAYDAEEAALFDILKDSDGNSPVVIYLDEEKARRDLPRNMTVDLKGDLVDVLVKRYGEEQVRVTY